MMCQLQGQGQIGVIDPTLTLTLLGSQGHYLYIGSDPVNLYHTYPVGIETRRR
jgi:hypothetical protein